MGWLGKWNPAPSYSRHFSDYLEFMTRPHVTPQLSPIGLIIETLATILCAMLAALLAAAAANFIPAATARTVCAIDSVAAAVYVWLMGTEPNFEWAWMRWVFWGSVAATCVTTTLRGVYGPLGRVYNRSMKTHIDSGGLAALCRIQDAVTLVGVMSAGLGAFPFLQVMVNCTCDSDNCFELCAKYAVHTPGVYTAGAIAIACGTFIASSVLRVQIFGRC